VLRIVAGQQIETFDGEGGVDLWDVSGVSHKEISLTLLEHRDAPRRSPVRLVLGLNPLKGGNEEPAIRMAAAMEVSEIVPVFFRRSEVPIDFDRLEKRLVRWLRMCVSEVSLSGGAYVPKISRPTTPSLLLDGKIEGVLFDEEADPQVESLSFHQGSTVIALVGPEGGLERAEVELARERGLRIASLGPWVLRAELAGTLVPSWVYARVQ
jgi:16S rRNA (uracil1498-N3)-methyltransferase